MARARRSTGPTPVEATTHPDKRANIPTADAQDLVDPELAEIKRVTLERGIMSPQLIWKGKLDDDFEAEAPQIYIQEKVDPRVLIENLRQTAGAGEAEPELTLFDTFDGLDELDAIDFYRHEANWSNRMILGDSLMVMASLAEREQLRGKVQMIYIDPPYGIKFGSNWQVSARKRDVKDGKLEDAAREAEQIKAFRDTWELGIHSYLSYLRDRLIVARDLLTESGSCFVQISEENLHVVRSILDEVFGAGNSISVIAFAKSGVTDSDVISRTHDYLLWYAKDREQVKLRRLWQPRRERTEGGTFTWLELANGSSRRMTRAEKENPDVRPAGARAFRASDVSSQGASVGLPEPVEFEGRTFLPSPSRHWNASTVRRAAAAGRIVAQKTVLAYKRFEDDFPLMPISHVWDDTILGTFSDKFYVVQTGSVAVERCMLMCTDPGDLVLDPTCGSGTTAYVAEQWGRRWITIDTSRVALALARQRLMGAKYPYYLLADSEAGHAKEMELSGRGFDTRPSGATQPPGDARPSGATQPPGFGPVTNDIRQGFVYERVQHITLKSIANNPDIKEGMTRAEIDAAIKRHAEFEKLYDKPYEDKKTVRVTGPFTVESLSPHRALASTSSASRVGGSASGVIDEPASETTAATVGGADFEQTILDNLAKAGIQNGRRNERIEFASLEAYAGAYVQAVGERVFAEAARAAPTRVAIALGPQYGTVSPSFIKEAAKEAIQDESIDLLCILGFAFDPTAGEVGDEHGVEVEESDFAGVVGQRRIGRVPVLYVRMNVDLLMGEDLAKTGAGNLFTVFGEPDIDISETDDGVVVELRGVDVYDPTSGELRPDDTSKIALWMIDTNYNGESFFVRHCYFTGGGDPYKRLKTALKADIDADAWASLYSTTSRPFAKPETGKIAVKVINDYGDEVMKVFEI